jgi:hypothetical protein
MVGYSESKNRWVVFSVPEFEPVNGYTTRDEAVGVALADVCREGGWLTVHFGDGAVESHRQYAAARASTASGPPEAALRRDQEVEVAPLIEDREASFVEDREASFGENRAGSRVERREPDPAAVVDSRPGRALDLLSVVGLFGIPLVTGVYSSEILVAAQNDTRVLYAVGLAWAWGFAVVAVAMSGGLRQPRRGGLVAALLCFVVSGYIAGEIGVGGLAASVARSGSLFESVRGMLSSALHAYGPGGAVATAGMGVFFGWRIARRLPGSKPNPREA